MNKVPHTNRTKEENMMQKMKSIKFSDMQKENTPTRSLWLYHK